MPSAKYAFSLSSLKFSKGRTATLFARIADATLPVGSAGLDVIFRGGARWKNINELITMAIANTSKAPVSATLGQPGVLN